MYFREQIGSSFRVLAPSDSTQGFIQSHLKVLLRPGELMCVPPGRSSPKAESFVPMHLNAGARKGRVEGNNGER